MSFSGFPPLIKHANGRLVGLRHRLSAHVLPLRLPTLLQLAMCIVLAACLMQFSGRVLPASWLSLLGLIAFGLYLPTRLRQLGLLLMVGVVLAHGVHQAMQGRLPAALENQPLWVTGQVASLPQRQDFNDRILLAVEACEPSCGSLRQLSLSWSAPKGGGIAAARSAAGSTAEQAVGDASADLEDDASQHAVWPQPGQRWRLKVKLKRPVAAVNPAAFDSEQRMLQQGIDAVGRVIDRERLPDDAGIAAGLMIQVEALRTALRDRLEQLWAAIDPKGGQSAQRWSLLGIVTGLSLGDQAAISAQQWALFSRTGVSHLMAISGMHVTLLAVLVVGITLWLHRRLVPLLPGRYVGWASALPRPWLVLGPGLLTAFGYALLSGWGVPAQRTCFMLAAAAMLRLGGRCHDALSPVLLAAAAIIVLDPWSVAQAGFWLSFGAVLALIWCAQQPLPPLLQATLNGRAAGILRNLHEGARNQWAATVLLTPLTILFFSTWSLIGPVANALAIPWVGLVLTPMSIAVMLLAPVWPWAAGWLLRALMWQLDLLMDCLQWLDALPMASIQLPRPGPWILLCALLGAVLLLAPAALRRPRLGLACLLPMLLLPARVPADDALVITALDIGQGSMILVEQGPHRLLYDTGGARAERTTLERVLLPYLHSQGLKDIDVLAISHLDGNHAGGAAAAARLLTPKLLLTAVDPRLLGIQPGPQALRLQPCLAGSRLPLGSATIEVLHPREMAHNRQAASDDARSCVIRVHHPAGSVLMAGDLPLRAEKALLQASGTASWRADVLVVPQQGSRNGAGTALLDAVRPRWAVIQTNHANAHGHPHPALQKRLVDREIELLRTDWHGAIRIELRPDREPLISRARIDDAPYWRVQTQP